MEQAHSPSIGIVVIGRNEGERLRRCLLALRDLGYPVVYADSGSTDGSPRLASQLGAQVVPLSADLPFTAARGRNEGFARLIELAPNVRYVQFIDGDCEVFPAWLGIASSYLNQHPDSAIVCGRLRERYPERSVYNRLCDAEWDRPPGEVLACGGIFMMRADVYRAMGGFRIDISAGEEPELCLRLRAAAWKIHRLAEPMAWHDADMMRFAQWWTRSRRNGYGYAQAVSEADPVERHHVRTAASAWVWAAGLPAAALALVLTLGPVAWTSLLVYPAQVLRMAFKSNGPWRHRFERAGFLVLGRFPELVGQLQWIRQVLAKGQARTPLFDKR